MSQKDIDKENNIIEQEEDATKIIKGIIQFLQMFLPITLAKRLVSMVLLAADVPVSRVTELTGLCDRSTRALKKSMKEEDVANLLKIKQGSGKKIKTADMESEISTCAVGFFNNKGNFRRTDLKVCFQIL